MFELWVIRHGQTYDNISQTLAQHEGGCLNEKGTEQAKLTGIRLQNESFQYAIVSDLKRTKQTFQNIAQPNKHNLLQIPEYTSLLREKWAGDAQGMRLMDFNKMAKESKVKMRDFKFPNGESWNDVNKRAKTFVSYIVNRFLRQKLEFDLTEYKGVPQNPLNSQANSNLLQEKFPEESKENTNPQPQKKEEEEEIENEFQENNTNTQNPKSGVNIPNETQIIKAIQSIKISENQKIQQKRVPKNGEPCKVLVVTHGGFVMELYNAIDFLKHGKPPSINNHAKNCSLNVFQIYCSKTKGQCTPKCSGYDCVQFNIKIQNDNSHCIKKK